MKKQLFKGKIIQIFQQKLNVINLAFETESNNECHILKFSGFSIHEHSYQLHDSISITGLWAWHKIYGRVIKGTIQPNTIRPVQRHRSNTKSTFNEQKFLEDLEQIGVKTVRKNTTLSL